MTGIDIKCLIWGGRNSQVAAWQKWAHMNSNGQRKWVTIQVATGVPGGSSRDVGTSGLWDKHATEGERLWNRGGGVRSPPSVTHS